MIGGRALGAGAEVDIVWLVLVGSLGFYFCLPTAVTTVAVVSVAAVLVGSLGLSPYQPAAVACGHYSRGKPLVPPLSTCGASAYGGCSGRPGFFPGL